MRHTARLSRNEIAEIVHAHSEGVTQTELALRFQVDRATISYHVKKYEHSYPEEGGVYALIKAKAQKTCHHPSATCTLCGLMEDELHRAERATIRDLTERLSKAEHQLRRAGLSVE